MKGRQAYQRRELGIGKCNCVQVRDVKEELTNNEVSVTKLLRTGLK
jgi:hypothetical protein